MMNLRRSFAACLVLSFTWGCSSSPEEREQAPGPSMPFPSGSAGSAGSVEPGENPDDGNEGMSPDLPLDGNMAGTGGTGSGTNPMVLVETGAPLPPPSPPTLPDPDAFSGTPQTLRQAALQGRRLIGTAVRADRLNNAAYTAAAREFNYVTPENEMKFDALER
ncbi:MAG: endo,4-beta-xylanase, partial [Pseudomonadota bacterium]